MKKKIVALSLVLCLAVVAVAGMTLAYFTDEKEAENVFTVGSVKIELYESTLHRTDWGKNGGYSDEAINYLRKQKGKVICLNDTEDETDFELHQVLKYEEGTMLSFFVPFV